MMFGAWRGSVGLIIPVRRPGILEQIQSVTPNGVCFFPAYNRIRHGSREEFSKALEECELRVAECAEVGVDLINPMGAPPFMLLGYKGELALIKDWEKKYKTPIFTSASNYVEALRALKVKRIAGFTYIPGEMNKVYAQYFVEAGFEVLCMEGMEVGFNAVPDLSARQCYQFIKSGFLKHRKEAQAIFLLGPGWPVLDIVQTIEDDCGVPVVNAAPAQSWEYQKRLQIYDPMHGFGQLLRELPGLR
jgi:maleate isomerase